MWRWRSGGRGKRGRGGRWSRKGGERSWHGNGPRKSSGGRWRGRDGELVLVQEREGEEAGAGDLREDGMGAAWPRGVPEVPPEVEELWLIGVQVELCEAQVR